MSVNQKALYSKLLEIYPEIERNDLSLSLGFDPDKAAWIVKLVNGKHALTTHLESKDADACFDGVQCINLGVQISQFMENFESGK